MILSYLFVVDCIFFQLRFDLFFFLMLYLFISIIIKSTHRSHPPIGYRDDKNIDDDDDDKQQ